jgi:hypothetical protein
MPNTTLEGGEFLISVKEILELVNEIESVDPIDWAMLNINEQHAAELIVNSVVDNYQTVWQNLGKEDCDKIMLATIAKLTLENFCLNLKKLQ